VSVAASIAVFLCSSVLQAARVSYASCARLLLAVTPRVLVSAVRSSTSVARLTRPYTAKWCRRLKAACQTRATGHRSYSGTIKCEHDAHLHHNQHRVHKYTSQCVTSQRCTLRRSSCLSACSWPHASTSHGCAASACVPAARFLRECFRHRNRKLRGILTAAAVPAAPPPRPSKHDSADAVCGDDAAAAVAGAAEASPEALRSVVDDVLGGLGLQERRPNKTTVEECVALFRELCARGLRVR
jgi:hypothetical protein